MYFHYLFSKLLVIDGLWIKYTVHILNIIMNIPRKAAPKNIHLNQSKPLHLSSPSITLH